VLLQALSTVIVVHEKLQAADAGARDGTFGSSSIVLHAHPSSPGFKPEHQACPCNHLMLWNKQNAAGRSLACNLAHQPNPQHLIFASIQAPNPISRRLRTACSDSHKPCLHEDASGNLAQTSPSPSGIGQPVSLTTAFFTRPAQFGFQGTASYPAASHRTAPAPQVWPPLTYS